MHGNGVSGLYIVGLSVGWLGTLMARRNAYIVSPRSQLNYKSKWHNIWIRDVVCYLYAQDKCPIMNQRSLFHP